MAIIKIARFWPGVRRTGAATAAAIDSDGLQAFGSEETSKGPGSGVLVLAPPPVPASARRKLAPALQWALVVSLGLGAVAAGVWAYQRRVAAQPLPGQLTLETTPAGLEVTIAGRAVGLTPLTLDLPAGSYEVRLGAGARQRVINATLTPGLSLVQRIEMPAAAAPATGSLRIETTPSRLPVFLDGIAQGPSPLTIADISPGDHDIVVGEGGAVRRTVSVKPNETVSLIVSAVERPAAASAGWLTVASPVRLQLREGGKVIGSTDMERLMLPAGSHTLELWNDALGYRAERRVTIAAGGTARLAVQVPKGTLSINAQPWAEVWVDGERLGETPIGNFTTPIGSHDIVFRHPEFGERRETVSVGLKQPARIGVDMRRQQVP